MCIMWTATRVCAKSVPLVESIFLFLKNTKNTTNLKQHMKSSHIFTFNEYLEREESEKCKLQTKPPSNQSPLKIYLSGKLCARDSH